MAERIREEQKSKHDDRVKALNVEILKLREKLMTDKEQHNKEETALNSAYDSADTNYLNNLEQYDTEMRATHEKIAQARKGYNEYASQLAGL